MQEFSPRICATLDKITSKCIHFQLSCTDYFSKRSPHFCKQHFACLKRYLWGSIPLTVGSANVVHKKTDTFWVSKQYSVRTDVKVGKRVYNDVTIFTKSNSDYNTLKFGTHFAEQSVYQAQNLTELYSCIFGCLCWRNYADVVTITTG